MDDSSIQNLRSPHREYAQQVLLSYPGVKIAYDVTFENVWKLFLDSGFLYPEKVSRLEPLLPEIHSTMRTMLACNGEVMSTVVIGPPEALDAHISLLRWCDETWIVQHLAALPLTGRGADATARLNLAFSYYGRIRPDIVWAKMYFRPNNVWPARVFGGFARGVEDPATADLRVFHYLVAPVDSACPEVSAGVNVRSATDTDSEIVREWFQERGRHAELAANHLDRVNYSSAAHQSLGLTRRREGLVAERDGKPAGFALLEFSSRGMNFSELTNSFTVHLFEPDRDTQLALIQAAKLRYAAAGYTHCVALEDGDADVFLAAGFSTSKDYACFTFHRQHLERMEEYFVALFGARKRATA